MPTMRSATLRDMRRRSEALRRRARAMALSRAAHARAVDMARGVEDMFDGASLRMAARDGE